METYRVKVFTPGHKLVFRNKMVRTPVTFFKVRKEEIALIDSQVRRSSLKYEVTKEDPFEKKESVTEEIYLDLVDEVKVEELEPKEPSTILEKLIAKDKE